MSWRRMQGWLVFSSLQCGFSAGPPPSGAAQGAGGGGVASPAPRGPPCCQSVYSVRVSCLWTDEATVIWALVYRNNLTKRRCDLPLLSLANSVGLYGRNTHIQDGPRLHGTGLHGHPQDSEAAYAGRFLPDDRGDARSTRIGTQGSCSASSTNQAFGPTTRSSTAFQGTPRNGAILRERHALPICCKP